MAMCATQVSGCNSNDNVTSVSAAEFEKEIRTDSVQLLDVRTPQEYSEGHIVGAINIDIHSDDFRRIAEKELSKDSTVFVYCRSGRRSLDAADRLTKLGYKVVNLKGGIIEWKDSGLTVTIPEKSKQTPDR
ncbi:MAG: rhodanese-like domain-containing protein [Duncaniella sp.]|nr:rhodanese-like domain-containing protein [Duncaniella sp.]